MGVTREQPPLIELGQRIKHLRQLAGLPRQADLADLAGIDRGTLNRAECGRQKLHRDSYDALISALQTRVQFSVVWFLHGEGEPPNTDAARNVEEYLTSPLGVDASAEVQAELRNMNWSALSPAHRTTKGIHRLREAIEMNLRMP
jgi:transcriptional regulator with XRE-family HTH domain